MKNLARYGLLAIVLGLTSAPAQAQAMQLRYVTVIVRDYDEALAWYTGVLGLKKTEDRNFGPGRRWLVVAPEGHDQPGIVLETASDPEKAGHIGKEINWVFALADCDKFYGALRARGVHFTAPPKRQPWGTTQAIFEDPYGNVYVAESQAQARQ